MRRRTKTLSSPWTTRTLISREHQHNEIVLLMPEGRFACGFGDAGDEKNSENAELIVDNPHLGIQIISAQRSRSADARRKACAWIRGRGSGNNSESAELTMDNAHLDIQRASSQRNRCDDGPEVRRKTRITHRMVPHVYSGAHVRSHKKGNSLRGKPESAARVTSCVSLALAYSGARGERLAGAL